MKRPLRIIVLILFLIVTLPIELEVLLYLLDPWGLKYFDDLAILWENVVSDPDRGYMLPAGTYKFSHWTATIDEGSVRAVPGNQHGSCKVLFIGDSVTWGHGVDDADTWISRIAEQMPQIDAINAALDGYNSENVRRGIADFPDAKVIVYFVIGNDAEPTSGWDYGLPQQPHLSMIEKYIRYLQLNAQINAPAPKSETAQQDPNYIRFKNDLQALADDGRVIFFAPKDVFEASIVSQYDIHELTADPKNPDRISAADPHPNPNGHRRVAAFILPFVQSAAAKACPQ
ncbi:MAG: SGNH/GDSL hydrolase family protein [Anaerolineae bacterium]